MKLTTIWTLPAMTLAERVHRTRDLANMKIAHRLPKRVKYWAYIQSGSSAMLPHEVVGEQTFMDLLKRLEGEPRS